MAEPFVGEIRMFSGSYAPQNWALCDGSLLPLFQPQNQPLFAIIGTTYGGDGRENFALPDLRGRTPLGAGQGPGFPLFNLGSVLGSGLPASNPDTQQLAVTFIICLAGQFPNRP